MNTNYLSVVSCAHCGEMIITAPDGTINCACTSRRSCKHREGMSDCHECTIVDLERQLAEARGKLGRIETEACVCTEGKTHWACLVHDEHSVIARILGGKGD